MPWPFFEFWEGLCSLRREDFALSIRNPFSINPLDTALPLIPCMLRGGDCMVKAFETTHCGSYWALYYMLDYADLSMEKKVGWEAGIFMNGEIFKTHWQGFTFYLKQHLHVWAQRQPYEVIVSPDWTPTIVASHSLQELCSIKAPWMLNYWIMNCCS